MKIENTYDLKRSSYRRRVDGPDFSMSECFTMERDGTRHYYVETQISRAVDAEHMQNLVKFIEWHYSNSPEAKSAKPDKWPTIAPIRLGGGSTLDIPISGPMTNASWQVLHWCISEHETPFIDFIDEEQARKSELALRVKEMTWRSVPAASREEAEELGLTTSYLIVEATRPLLKLDDESQIILPSFWRNVSSNPALSFPVWSRDFGTHDGYMEWTEKDSFPTTLLIDDPDLVQDFIETGEITFGVKLSDGAEPSMCRIIAYNEAGDSPLFVLPTEDITDTSSSDVYHWIRNNERLPSFAASRRGDGLQSETENRNEQRMANHVSTKSHIDVIRWTDWASSMQDRAKMFDSVVVRNRVGRKSKQESETN